MNKISLSHVTMPNQQQSSRNGDFYAGSAYMNHEKNLYQFCQCLVSVHNQNYDPRLELDIDMLSDEEQNKLALLYIESLEREIEWACYGEDESINSSFLCALLAMLQNNTDETRENFAEITRKNVLIYYKKSLDEMLSNAMGIYLNDVENGNSWYEEAIA